MTEEDLREYEKELNEILDQEEARLTDPPRYVLTGEIIPKEVLERKRPKKKTRAIDRK